ncbi:MAG: CHAT domain-containing protein [Sphingomonadales bacterium]|nr:CHAT domain-containing protein [Sphingomonadales bacterium]
MTKSAIRPGPRRRWGALLLALMAIPGPTIAADAPSPVPAQTPPAQTPPAPLDEAEAHLRAGQAAEQAGNLALALAELDAGITRLVPGPTTASRLVAALARQTRLLSYAGRFDEALRTSAHAHELALRFLPDRPDVLHGATLAYAEELVDRMRLAQAEAVMQQLLAVEQREAASERGAETLYELARIAFKRERRTEAAALIARAAAIVDPLSTVSHAELPGNIALEQARQAFENSQLDAALGHLDRAVARFAAMGAEGRVSVEIARQAQMSVLITAGRREEARRLMAGPWASAAKLPIQSAVRQNSEMVAALLRSFDPADAAEAYAQARPVFEAIVAQMHAPDRTPTERADYAVSRRTNVARFAAVALRAGETEAAFRAAQYMAWSDVSRSAARMARELARRDPLTGDALAEAERLADQAEALRAARNLAREHDGPAAERLGTELAGVEARYRAIYARLATEGAGQLRLGEPQIRSLADVQAGLPAHRAMLLLIPTDNRLMTMVVRRDQVSWSDSGLTIPAMKEAAARLRLSLAPGPQRPPFDRRAALTLGNAIMTPATLAALAGVDEIELVSAGPILSVPPAVLLAGPLDARRLARTPLARLPYLVRRFAFVFRPGLAPRSAPGAARRGFAGIGAPRLGAVAGPAGADATLRALAAPGLDLAALPPLTGAEDELRDLARSLGGDRSLVLTGSEATEARVRSADLRGYRTLVFATHGLTAGEVAGLSEPALVLTAGAPSEGQPAGAADDGLLTASEIATLEIDAEWAILSACNTGVEREPGSSTYSGLARAFMQAGVDSLLVSLWPVRDDAARQLSVATVLGHERGLSRGAALRGAMLQLIDNRRLPDAADPAIWAPFTLIER